MYRKCSGDQNNGAYAVKRNLFINDKGDFNNNMEESEEDPFYSHGSSYHHVDSLNCEQKSSDSPKKSSKKQSSTSDRALLRAVTWQYEEISAKLDFIIARLELLQKSVKPDEVVMKPKGQPSFPLATEEKLMTMENYLSSDVNLKLTMLYLQAHVDGLVSARKAVQTLLKTAISNRLARIISSGGSGSIKIAFSTTRLLECMICEIKSAFKSANLDDVRERVQRWLHTANQRKVEPITLDGGKPFPTKASNSKVSPKKASSLRKDLSPYKHAKKIVSSQKRKVLSPKLGRKGSSPRKITSHWRVSSRPRGLW